MFSLFSKKKSDTITKMGREVIQEGFAHFESILQKPKPVEIPKPNIQECYTYVSLLDNTPYKGVCISEVYSDKWNTKIHILVVTHCNTKRISPVLKWINEDNCIHISRYAISHLPDKLFNPDNWDLPHCKLKD